MQVTKEQKKSVMYWRKGGKGVRKGRKEEKGSRCERKNTDNECTKEGRKEGSGGVEWRGWTVTEKKLGRT